MINVPGDSCLHFWDKTMFAEINIHGLFHVSWPVLLRQDHSAIVFAAIYVCYWNAVVKCTCTKKSLTNINEFQYLAKKFIFSIPLVQYLQFWQWIFLKLDSGLSHILTGDLCNTKFVLSSSWSLHDVKSPILEINDHTHMTKQRIVQRIQRSSHKSVTSWTICSTLLVPVLGLRNLQNTGSFAPSVFGVNASSETDIYSEYLIPITFV